jgi:hypothetical protein
MVAIGECYRHRQIRRLKLHYTIRIFVRHYATSCDITILCSVVRYCPKFSVTKEHISVVYLQYFLYYTIVVYKNEAKSCKLPRKILRLNLLFCTFFTQGERSRHRLIEFQLKSPTLLTLFLTANQH